MNKEKLMELFHKAHDFVMNDIEYVAMIESSSNPVHTYSAFVENVFNNLLAEDLDNE